MLNHALPTPPVAYLALSLRNNIEISYKLILNHLLWI